MVPGIVEYKYRVSANYQVLAQFSLRASSTITITSLEGGAIPRPTIRLRFTIRVLRLPIPSALLLFRRGARIWGDEKSSILATRDESFISPHVWFVGDGWLTSLPNKCLFADNFLTIHYVSGSTDTSFTNHRSQNYLSTSWSTLVKEYTNNRNLYRNSTLTISTTFGPQNTNQEK